MRRAATTTVFLLAMLALGCQGGGCTGPDVIEPGAIPDGWSPAPPPKVDARGIGMETVRALLDAWQDVTDDGDLTIGDTVNAAVDTASAALKKAGVWQKKVGPFTTVESLVETVKVVAMNGLTPGGHWQRILVDGQLEGGEVGLEVARAVAVILLDAFEAGAVTYGDLFTLVAAPTKIALVELGLWKKVIHEEPGAPPTTLGMVVDQALGDAEEWLRTFGVWDKVAFEVEGDGAPGMEEILPGLTDPTELDQVRETLWDLEDAA